MKGGPSRRIIQAVAHEVRIIARGIERAEELRPDQEVKKATLEMDFATLRLGTKIVDLENVSKAYGDKVLLNDFSWILEPGARVGLIGRNGYGKTTLLDILSGRLEADSGVVERGTTVKLGYLDQETKILDPNLKVLDSLKSVAEQISLSNGQTISAAQMLERFLFSGRLQHTLVGRLSARRSQTNNPITTATARTISRIWPTPAPPCSRPKVIPLLSTSVRYSPSGWPGGPEASGSTGTEASNGRRPSGPVTHHLLA